MKDRQTVAFYQYPQSAIVLNKICSMVKWKFQLVSWARLQSIKLSLDLRMNLRANEIAFKCGGQIMAGIIKTEPLRRSYKTPGVIISHDLPLFGFRMQYINIFSREKSVVGIGLSFYYYFFLFSRYIYIDLKF